MLAFNEEFVIYMALETVPLVSVALLAVEFNDKQVLFEAR